MNINSIVDNTKVTSGVKNVYKFIDKNEDNIKRIFDTVYTDLSSIFTDVIKEEETIIVTINEDSINSVKAMVDDMLDKHTKDVLGDKNLFVIPYVFRITTIGKTVSIMLKR